MREKPDLGGDELSSSEDQASTRKKLKPKPKRRKRPHENPLALLPSQPDAGRTGDLLLATLEALTRRLLVQKVSRHEMKALSTMLDVDLRANSVNRVGHVPKIKVGDIFYYRTEMCLVGLHAQLVNGIDIMKVKFGDPVDKLAICVVSSGGYDNVDGELDSLIYTGQGGGIYTNDKKPADDQKLERGNLALERSLKRENEIRVIRSLDRQKGKIYIYDGIYTVRESWNEIAKSGFDVFKYKLLREPNQPDGFAVWMMVQRWKRKPSSRVSGILTDIALGAEKLPVYLVSEIDAGRPSHFEYATNVKYLNPVSRKITLQACLCKKVCNSADANCSCVESNGGDPPYLPNDVLLSCKPLIYECNSSCQCPIICRNRVTQMRVQLQFEVFRTRDCGWGLRSWDPIRAGTFLCEYIGEISDHTKVEGGEKDDYLFHSWQDNGNSFNSSIVPELLKEPSLVYSSDSFEPLTINLSAKRIGNFSRFMNHSCSPNVFWQPVVHDPHDERYPHICFFATKHIPPMTELTYDYGTTEITIPTLENEADVSHGSKKCLCGSSKCRGSFG